MYNGIDSVGVDL